MQRLDVGPPFFLAEQDQADTCIAPITVLHSRNSSTGRELQRVTQKSKALDVLERKQLEDYTRKDVDSEPAEPAEPINELHLTTTKEQKHKKALMQCLLLEMGILFHSVFIGMALSVAVGNDFIVLLIAITFHREFFSAPIYCTTHD